MTNKHQTNQLGDGSNLGGKGLRQESKKANRKNNQDGHTPIGSDGNKGISNNRQGDAKNDRKAFESRRDSCLKNGLIAYSLKAIAEYHMIDYSTAMRWKDKGLIIPITINAKLKKSKPLYLDRKTSRLIREGLVATNKDKNV